MKQVNAYIIYYTLKDYNDVRHERIMLYHTSKSKALAMFNEWAKKRYIGDDVIIDAVKQRNKSADMNNRTLEYIQKQADYIATMKRGGLKGMLTAGLKKYKTKRGLARYLVICDIAGREKKYYASQLEPYRDEINTRANMLVSDLNAMARYCKQFIGGWDRTLLTLKVMLKYVFLGFEIQENIIALWGIKL